jgi:hypothetical protein
MFSLPANYWNCLPEKFKQNASLSNPTKRITKIA